jgi:hypothetical protein
MESFAHIVEVKRETRKLAISRLYAGGKRELFTEIDFPPSGVAIDDAVAYEKFTKLLGENLLLDSPLARELLSL